MAEKVWKFSLDIETERKSEAQHIYKEMMEFLKNRTIKVKVSSSPIYGTRKYRHRDEFKSRKTNS